MSALPILPGIFQRVRSRFHRGASGKLEFYIITKVDNLSSVTIQLDTAAYVYGSRTDKSGNAAKSWDAKLQELVSGHILLFRSSSDADGYGECLSIEDNGKFIVKAPKTSGDSAAAAGEEEAGNDTATFQKGIPYKVTLKWVWPKYFRNYVYNQRTNGDLYSDSKSQNYKTFLVFVQNQAALNQGYSKMFCTQDSGEGSQGEENTWTVKKENISNSMNQADYDLCTKYYNNADEYIGSNADFLYVEATAQ